MSPLPKCQNHKLQGNEKRAKALNSTLAKERKILRICVRIREWLWCQGSCYKQLILSGVELTSNLCPKTAHFGTSRLIFFKL